ncbi:MAG: glutamate dehydrogenase [Deltaproteobacteria bacterium]|nr:glutamate dehydrogenase [Deltaproteobacteria bacterium]
MTDILNLIKNRDPGEREFHQAVEEVIESVQPVLDRNPQYRQDAVLERITEPERVIMFRVPWMDDQGQVHVNRAFRVQMNSAIGPYKGGLRFHPSVNLSILKFLAFEQVFKNALTTLSMGGGKGGSDFDPKGKSDNEVMRFCQSFNEFTGVLTGKSLGWGGSLIRPEATGYGSVYFAAEMLATQNQTFEGKTCLVSGSGNVAQYTVEKIVELGGKVVTLSDSSGYIYDEAGIDSEKLDFVKRLKNIKRGRISEYIDKYSEAVYTEADTSLDYNPLWNHKSDCAFPSATENEINATDAANLMKNGVHLVCEGANMPSTPEAINIFLDNKILYAPGKASNAGGVAVSGLEMAQNSMRLNWPADEVDRRLKIIMKNIHQTCLDASAEYGVSGNYMAGANIAGFTKVVTAMVDQGLL